jgi:hypothetical protein
LTLTVEGAGEEVTEIGSVLVPKRVAQFGESRTLVRVRKRMTRCLPIVGLPTNQLYFILPRMNYPVNGNFGGERPEGRTGKLASGSV